MLRVDVTVGRWRSRGLRRSRRQPFSRQGWGCLPEIWSIGWRNPWRWSFDDPSLRRNRSAHRRGRRPGRARGNRLRAGRRRRPQLRLAQPGRHARHISAEPATGVSAADRPDLRLWTIGRASGDRRVRLPRHRARIELSGPIFLCGLRAGRVWSLALSIAPGTGEATASNLVEHTAELGGTATIGNITSFGVDAGGELYLCSFNGRIHRILPGTRDAKPGDEHRSAAQWLESCASRL